MVTFRKFLPSLSPLPFPPFPTSPPPLLPSSLLPFSPSSPPPFSPFFPFPSPPPLAPESVPEPSHDEISPFSPLAREKRISLLRAYPYTVELGQYTNILICRNTGNHNIISIHPITVSIYRNIVLYRNILTYFRGY